MKLTLEDIIYKLENKIPFAFSRWGDGEWLNVNESNGANCDGNIYYEDLGFELKKIALVPQDYYMGIMTHIYNDEAHYYVKRESEKYPQQWHDSDILHKASIDDKLKDLITALHNSYIVYIGNESLKKLDFTNEFIEIPYSNCWDIQDEIINKIKLTFALNYHKVYLFSAGMATNVFIDKLWKSNNTNTYLDVGSVFDPYVGRLTRNYHKKLKW